MLLNVEASIEQRINSIQRIDLKKKTRILLIFKSSQTLAYNSNARRAYENSEHAEDFGRIIISLFLKLVLAVTY